MSKLTMMTNLILFEKYIFTRIEISRFY